MLDNQLIQIFIPIIQYGLNLSGYPSFPVQQSFHPVQQGEDDFPSLYFFKVMDYRYGYVEHYDVWDPVNRVLNHTEIQNYETTFQMNCRAIQNPSITNSVTASDYLNMAAQSLQSDYAVTTLFSNNVQILRVTTIRNLFFINDRDRQESYPSFDFVLKHQNVYETQIPEVSSFTQGIYPI